MKYFLFGILFSSLVIAAVPKKEGTSSKLNASDGVLFGNLRNLSEETVEISTNNYLIKLPRKNLVLAVDGSLPKISDEVAISLEGVDLAEVEKNAKAEAPSKKKQ
jgi:hypothetical protein